MQILMLLFDVVTASCGDSFNIIILLHQYQSYQMRFNGDFTNVLVSGVAHYPEKASSVLGQGTAPCSIECNHRVTDFMAIVK